MNKGYSQNGEEEIILDYFGDYKGKLLDIGACDGLMVSNTRQLLLNGWSGDLIEPGRVYSKLEGLYKDNKNVNLHKIAIGTKEGKFKFYDSGEGISTFDEKHRDRWIKSNNVQYEETEVDMISVDKLFEMVGYDFDFISLDTEAMNWDIFLRLPFDKLKKLRLIVVEHDKKYEQMKYMIDSYGFKEIAMNQENIIFAKEK
jgi:FkbM family methyltransferase